MQVTGSKSLIQNRLSIRIGADGFSFITTDATGRQLFAREDYPLAEGDNLLSALENVLSRPSISRPEYGEVLVLSDCESTRVPMDEFRSNEARALFRLTFGAIDVGSRTVRHDVLPALEVVELYTVDAAVEQLVARYYPQAQWRGYYGQMMLQAVQSVAAKERKLFLVEERSSLFIFQLQGKKLLFANTFKADKISNKLFFLLSVWKLLELDQYADSCTMLNASEEFSKEVSLYIKNVCAL